MPHVPPTEVPEQGAGDITQILSRLGRQSVDLIRTEGKLARAEVNEKITDLKQGIASLVTSSVILLAGVIVLLMSAVYGLALVLPQWLAALIVGGAVTLIGAIMASAGAAKLRKENLEPDHTIDQVRQDVRLAKEQAA